MERTARRLCAGDQRSQAPIALPTGNASIAALRGGLLVNGFAFATSSDRENGYNLKDAATRTHQLRGLFVSQVGQPTRVYLMGHSLGALAILKLAEMYPSQYD